MLVMAKNPLSHGYGVAKGISVLTARFAKAGYSERSPLHTALSHLDKSPLHTALSHLDKRNTNVRMLFIDYSLVFNTIVLTLGLNTCLCNWILDFVTGRPQVVRVGNDISAMLFLKKGAP
jgi:hypothetical protein